MSGGGSPLAWQSNITDWPSLQVELLGGDTFQLGGRLTRSEAV